VVIPHGRGEERRDHDCLDDLVYCEYEWVETHGLECGPYERCRDEWWECAVCGNWFTGNELDEMIRRLNKEV
jgi:hypothetical protein